MNRKQKGLIAIGIFVVILLIASVILTSTEWSERKKLKVVTSFYTMSFFASMIGGEETDVSMLIPENSEPHTWEPKPSDIVAIDEADIFIYNGAGLEPWVEDILSAIHNKKLEVIDTSKGVDLILSEETERLLTESEELFLSGPFIALNTSADGEHAPLITPEKKCINITPVQNISNYLTLLIENEGDYALFFSQDLNVTVSNPSGGILSPEASITHPDRHPGIRLGLIYEFMQGRYTLLFEGKTPFKMSFLRLEGHAHGLTDPHIWLDPLLAKVQVKNILSGFLHVDPKNADSYRSRTAALESKLEALHQQFSTELKNRTKNDIVATHNAFGYMAHRYGFNAHGAIGISADEQPSAEALARLADMVRTLGLRYVYVEPGYPDEYMQTIARETGAGVLILDGIHGRAGVHASMDYFEIMEENLHNLMIGLEVK